MLKKSEILRKIKSNTKDLSVNNSYTDIISFCKKHKHDIKCYQERGHSYDYTKYWGTLNFIVKDKNDCAFVKATKRDTWIQDLYEPQYAHEQQYIIEWACNPQTDYKITCTPTSQSIRQDMTAQIVFAAIDKMSARTRS